MLDFGKLKKHKEAGMGVFKLEVTIGDQRIVSETISEDEARKLAPGLGLTWAQNEMSRCTVEGVLFQITRGK